MEEEKGIVAGSQDAVAVWADWDDVHAARLIGEERSELSVVTTAHADDKIEAELVSITGHRGRLVITRDFAAGRDSRGCERLTISCTVGGNAGGRQAARMVAGIKDRLEQLAGVGWAPIR